MVDNNGYQKRPTQVGGKKKTKSLNGFMSEAN